MPDPFSRNPSSSLVARALQPQTAGDSRKQLRELSKPNRIHSSVVKQDVDLMIWSIKLHSVRRFVYQRFWEEESRDAKYAMKLESIPRLESVSEHSWHVADSVLLIAPHFSDLDLGRCLKLAILHDKLEILTGDIKVLGRDGSGKRTHAFNETARKLKQNVEMAALDQYLMQLRQDLGDEHRDLFLDAMNGTSNEAKFVKAIDKLQCFSYVHVKKNGNIEDQHMLFTILYAHRAIDFFPPFAPHYNYLKKVFVAKIARRRSISVGKLHELLRALSHDQLTLFGNQI